MATRSYLFVTSVFAIALLLITAVPSADAALLKPKLMDSESYGETWTAIADLEDGTYVLLQYVFTNAGMGDGKGGCRALVVGPGKKGHNAATRVDRDEWSYNSAKKSLKVGACSLSSSGGRTTFVARAGKISVRLTLREGLKRVRPPGHRVRAGDDFFEAEVLILHHPTTIQENYQPVVHARTVRQTARILFMDKPLLRTGDRAMVRFRFMYRPEYLQVGTKVLFTEGKTKAIGSIKELVSPTAASPDAVG